MFGEIQPKRQLHFFRRFERRCLFVRESEPCCCSNLVSVLFSFSQELAMHHLEDLLKKECFRPLETVCCSLAVEIVTKTSFSEKNSSLLSKMEVYNYLLLSQETRRIRSMFNIVC